MTNSVINISSLTKASLAVALLIGASPALAQDAGSARGDSPNAVDVAKTPLTDLNLAKDPIPQMLLDAQEYAYDRPTPFNCTSLREEVAELDILLGPDYDLMAAEDGGNKVNGGRVAQSLVGSFIPFRGILREATGAKKHEQQFKDAIAAGLVRRGYLKGIGEARGCTAPAKPAPKGTLIPSAE